MKARALALLGVSLLAACKGPSAEKLSLATWGSAEEVSVLREVLAGFGEPVELVHAPAHYAQKLHLLAAAKQTPDVCFVSNLDLPKFARAGVFAPLKNRLSAGEASAFYPAALTALKDGGRLYALPRDVSNLVVYYNADAFAEAGLPRPRAGWTVSEFAAAARALSRPGAPAARRYGLGFEARPLFWLPWVWSFGGEVLDAGGRVRLDEPAAIAGISAYAQLVADGAAPPAAWRAGAPMMQRFVEGKVAMVVSGRWSVPALRQGARFAWDVAPFPAGPAGSIVDADASGWAISARAQDPERAWRLVRYLAGPEAARAFAASGLIVPARRAVAEEALAGPAAGKEPPRSGRVFLAALETGRPIHAAGQWALVSGVLSEVFEPVWEGRMPPEVGARAAAGALRERLAETAP